MIHEYNVKSKHSSELQTKKTQYIYIYTFNLKLTKLRKLKQTLDGGKYDVVRRGLNLYEFRAAETLRSPEIAILKSNYSFSSPCFREISVWLAL